MGEKFTIKDAIDLDFNSKRKGAFIAAIGLELEGGWPAGGPRGGGQIVRDGSVVFGVEREEYEYLRTQGHDPMRYTAYKEKQSDGSWRWRIDHRRDFVRPIPKLIGELPSPKLMLSEWVKWLHENYPTEVNETCGMHVHMSFGNALQYMLCMNKAYPATIVKSFTDWSRENLAKDHPIWERLAAKSVYCQHLYDAEAQAQATDKGHNQHSPGHRYTVTNYAYTRLRTVECRLLPMMSNADLAQRAIERLLDTTERFLYTVAHKERPRVVEVSMNEEIPIKERMIECV